jgi:DNA (cytosine-5)-methyltransferase 1
MTLEIKKTAFIQSALNSENGAQGVSAHAAQVVDLCCGLGGLSLAAKQLGLKVVCGIDIDKNSIKTYEKNFPESLAINGSIRSKLHIEKCSELLSRNKEIPSIILSGPPCQGFSMAGTRDPKDLRNKVIVAVAHAISKLEPECALIENVSMVLAKKYGKRLSKFEKILFEKGYFVTSFVLDASNFGISQKRKRAFFLVSKKLVDEKTFLSMLEKYKSPALGAMHALTGLPKPKTRPDIYCDENDNGKFTNHFAMQHSKKVMDKISKIQPGTGPMSYRRLHPTRPSNTLFSGHRAPPAHYKEPRSITVREAARLQGFPDSFKVYGTFSNQMTQVTNAVPPPLASVVLKVLVEILGLKK